ncbi:hypothetical protein F5Y10DRAFT_272183 [Nemania abortiva]|nr:hypothetical protein F5Y10DRAFT_272183 [Nemania abortiva]
MSTSNKISDLAIQEIEEDIEEMTLKKEGHEKEIERLKEFLGGMDETTQEITTEASKAARLFRGKPLTNNNHQQLLDTHQEMIDSLEGRISEKKKRLEEMKELFKF